MKSKPEVTAKHKRRVRVRLITDDADYDRLARPMHLACVSWLRDQGYDVDEIAAFLGLRRKIVETLSDVEGIDIGVILGPEAKAAQARGLI
jgi:hypothetical protein